jgi:DNA-binding response OmpR family regulator
VAFSAEVLDDRHATILVCEDEESIRQIVRAQLTARAYCYCEATAGNEVLRAVPVLRPDAILLDLGLPDMDGIEVVKRIRLSTRTPMMVVSVRARTAEKIAALDATEYELLEVLVLYAGRLLTQRRFSHELWGRCKMTNRWDYSGLRSAHSVKSYRPIPYVPITSQ